MRLMEYLADKIVVILINAASMMTLSIYLLATGNYVTNIELILIAWLFILLVYFGIDYVIRKSYFKRIEDLLEKLDKRYLIAEVIGEVPELEDRLYKEILRKSNKSVIEEIHKLKQAQAEYKEYIEGWIHDVKSPLTAIELICENNKNEYTTRIKGELGKIENQVENVLYYARIEQVYKDYLIHRTDLKKVVISAVQKNKLYFIQNKMQVNVDMEETIVSTDEKWVEFLLNQMFVNAIKYRRSYEPRVNIMAKRGDKYVELIIEDNGIGISKKDINRIFEKGFTGSNGRERCQIGSNGIEQCRSGSEDEYVQGENGTSYMTTEMGKHSGERYDEGKSTGIGLYLCKNLCDKLDVGIRCESEKGSYTRMYLTFPDSNHNEI